MKRAKRSFLSEWKQSAPLKWLSDFWRAEIWRGRGTNIEGLFDRKRQESAAKTKLLLWLRRTVIQFRNGNLLYTLLCFLYGTWVSTCAVLGQRQYEYFLFHVLYQGPRLGQHFSCFETCNPGRVLFKPNHDNPSQTECKAWISSLFVPADIWLLGITYRHAKWWQMKQHEVSVHFKEWSLQGIGKHTAKQSLTIHFCVLWFCQNQRECIYFGTNNCGKCL